MNAKYVKQKFGIAGIEVVTDTAAHTRAAGYCSLQVIADATISAITASPAIAGNALTGFVIPAGSVLFFPFTSITLTSGKVILYNAV